MPDDAGAAKPCSVAADVFAYTTPRVTRPVPTVVAGLLTTNCFPRVPHPAILAAKGDLAAAELRTPRDIFNQDLPVSLATTLRTSKVKPLVAGLAKAAAMRLASAGLAATQAEVDLAS